jgi:hypothetical protein
VSDTLWIMAGSEGSGILRHQARDDGWVAPQGQRQEVADAIDRHFTEHFGPIDCVLHEIVSHRVAVHVYVLEPTDQRPFRTLITSGMSELPMTVPQGHGISPYAELAICLPADWPLDQESFRDENVYWPVRLLKQVARLPHEYGTWVGAWHSVPNGDPADPYAPATPFAGVAVVPMLTVPKEAQTIEVGGGTRIELLALLPLHPAEIALKRERGTNALIEALDRGHITEAFDPNRPPLV